MTLEELFKVPRMYYMPMTPKNSVKGLYDMAKDIMRNDFLVVEVGSFAGVSSDLLARFCKTLICIDAWDLGNVPDSIPKDMAAEALKRFNEVKSRHDNILSARAYSSIAIDWFKDGELDLVYIDASHDYASVKSDIMGWMPKVKKGGWITGHDLPNPGDGVEKAVREIFGNDFRSYEDTSWAHQNY